MGLEYNPINPSDEMEPEQAPMSFSRTRKKDQVPAKDPSARLEAKENDRQARAELASRNVEVQPQEQDSSYIPERCRGLEMELPDGRTVVMEIPNIAVQILAEKILANRVFQDPNMMQFIMSEVKAVLYIKSIDGEEIERPTNEVKFNALVNRLGDIGLECVTAMYLESFPPVHKSELKIVKKY